MPKIDWERERKVLDREITFFHFRKAERKIKKCLNLAEESGEEFFFYYFLAQKFILGEDFYQAIEHFNRALKIRKNDGCTYNDKAICLAELEKYRQALDCFNEGIKRDKDCVSLYHNKGWLLNLLRRYKEAILCFNKALELEEDRVESLYSLGDTYLQLGDRPRAKRYFQKALRYIKGKSFYVYNQILKKLKNL